MRYIYRPTGVVRNATKRYGSYARFRRYVRWARMRYRQAGITLPRIHYRQGGRAAELNKAAIAWSDGSKFIIYVNLVGKHDTVMKKVLLHEHAHCWDMAGYFPRGRRAAFLERRGLQHWGSPAPWNKRGSEQLAEFVAWGLMDRNLRLLGIGDPSNTEKRKQFRWLTGKTPLHGR